MIYNLENENLKISILDVGASILSMQYLRNGEWVETTLQYEDLNTYSQDNPYYLNAIIGPHSGRIKDGEYVLDGNVVALEKNDRGNHLHGGTNGFHTLVFEKQFHTKNKCILESKHKDYQCKIRVTFTILGSELEIEYEVISDIDQVMNMTQHTYFNLSGEDTVENHTIRVSADRFSELDESGAPLRMIDVTGPFDLRAPGYLKDKMALSHPQFEISGNIDHVFEVGDGGVDLYSELSGVGVKITADRPYAVVYTGNYFLGETEFKGLGASKLHQAVAVEPQHLPNDVNLDLGVSQIVKKGELYTQKIKYSFYCDQTGDVRTT